MPLTVHVSTMTESFRIRYRLQLSSATTASALPAESTVSKYGCDSTRHENIAAGETECHQKRAYIA